MKMRYLVISILLTIGLNSMAQSYFNVADEPVKHIRLNFVFLRNSSGEGGFDTTTDSYHIQNMISGLNSIYSNIQTEYDAPCYDGSMGLVSDAKVRFDVLNQYEVDDDYYWNNENSGDDFCPNYAGYHLQPLEDSYAASNPIPIVSVFFTETASAIDSIIENGVCPWTSVVDNYFTSVSCSEAPSYLNFSLEQSVHMRNKYLKYYWMMNCVANNAMNDPDLTSYPPEVVYWWLAPGKGLAHELGHTLGLGHTNPNDCRCSEHLMMNDDCNDGTFLSPIEVNTIHQVLATKSIRKYVPNNTFGTTPISISSNDSWTQNIRIYRGINHTAGTFQINNVLIAPAEVDIVTTNSAYLEFNNATVSPANTNSRPELRATSNATVEINNSTISDFDVSIEDNAEIIINNSTINIPNGGSFTTESGTVFTMNSGLIQ